jgi:hypothetical protein
VARGLLATDAGDCGGGHLWQATTGGGGSRRKAARASVVPCTSKGPHGLARGDPRPLGHGALLRPAMAVAAAFMREGAMPVAAEGRENPRRLARARRGARPSPGQPEVAQPRLPAAAPERRELPWTDCSGGFRSSRDTQSVEEEEAKVMARAFEHGEGQRRGGMELGWLGNGGHDHGGVRTRAGTERQVRVSEKARNRAWQVLWCSPHRARRRSTRRPWQTPTRAWWTRTQHAAPSEAIFRTGGGQPSVRRGSQFWAISGLNLDMGPIQSLKPVQSSMIFL